MRRFIKRALQKIDRLSQEQFRSLLFSSAREIDRLETAIDSIPRGILVCDISHKIILANKTAGRFLSVPTEKYTGEPVWNLIPEEQVADFLASTILSTDKAEEREFQVGSGGVVRLLSVSVMPLVQSKKITGSIILVDDITERKFREVRLRRMENLASLTTLAATVAHEIKNPLGSLSIHVQLIQKTVNAKKNSPPEQNLDLQSIDRIEKYLGIINQEIERLNGIVMDFLFAVRPMNVEPKRSSINSLIRELLKFVSHELEEAGIECVTSLSENLPLVDIDEKLMKQALLNLIKNAAHAMNPGGKLYISTEAAGGEALIIIADNGEGISEENLAKIFEPYFTTKNSGTGLGLTMTFKIIKEHQGDINVKSRKGEGTVFSITLPMPEGERRLIPYNAAVKEEVP